MARKMSDDEELALIENRVQLARQLEAEAAIHIRKLTQKAAGAVSDPAKWATCVVRQAARDIRGDVTGKLTITRALGVCSTYEYDENGDPQVFPFDSASTAVVAKERALKPDDTSTDAKYIRDVAGSVHDHRKAFQRGHNRGGHTCRGDLYRGLCHGTDRYPGLSR